MVVQISKKYYSNSALLYDQNLQTRGRIAMIFHPQCIGAVIVTSFPIFIFADYFTNPPNFVATDGEPTQDLSTKFTLGQEVQITWFVPKLSKISLSLAHWSGGTITSFLS